MLKLNLETSDFKEEREAIIAFTDTVIAQVQNSGLDQASDAVREGAYSMALVLGLMAALANKIETAYEKLKAQQATATPVTTTMDPVNSLEEYFRRLQQ